MKKVAPNRECARFEQQIPGWSIGVNNGTATGTCPGGGTCNKGLIASDLTVDTANWYFIVGSYTYDSLKIYVDGLLDTSLGSVNLDLLNSTQPLFIGRESPSASFARFFRGKIDDVHIYNFALSETEIDSLYHLSGWPLPPVKGLVALYPFNGNANDESGNGHNGAVSGAVLTKDRFGTSNRAYYFDGDKDGINIGDLGTIRDYTVSLWFKKAIAIGYPAPGDLQGRNLFATLDTNNCHEQFDIFFPAGSSPDRIMVFIEDKGCQNNSYASIFPDKTFQDTLWHHLVVTRSSTQLAIYADNLEIARTSAVSAADPIESGGQPTKIGNRGGLDPLIEDEAFHGSIDDVRVYNTILSNAEISALFHEGGWQGYPPPGMKFINGGTFQMGQIGIAEPVHQVTISNDFWIDSTEVTQADYLSVMGVNPSQFTGDLKRPVETVSWFDAVLYCNARSKRYGYDTVYSYNSVSGTPGDKCSNLGNLNIDYSKTGYRLPTEAEWEYACRAGTTTIFCWDSGNVSDYAWYDGNSDFQVHPVAQKLPNPWALYDMAGNVWEWCADWFGPYENGAQINPIGAINGDIRMHRGGCRRDGVDEFRSADRHEHDQVSVTVPPGNNGGFRAILPVQ